MRTSRRKFFGIMGGAAAAGPGIAKEAVARLPDGLGSAIISSPSYGDPSRSTADSIDGEWKLARIAKIKRMLAGDFTDDEKEERNRRRMYAVQSLISQDVAGLKSVSGVRKLEIYNRRVADLYDEIYRSELNSDLFRLLTGDR